MELIFAMHYARELWRMLVVRLGPLLARLRARPRNPNVGVTWDGRMYVKDINALIRSPKVQADIRVLSGRLTPQQWEEVQTAVRQEPPR